MAPFPLISSQNCLHAFMSACAHILTGCDSHLPHLRGVCVYSHTHILFRHDRFDFGDV